MLIANSTYDPVTPMSAARNVSEKFKGSVLQQHDGYGHGVMGDPNLCTERAIRRFFKMRELPEKGTVGGPDVPPFAVGGGLGGLLGGGGGTRKRTGEGFLGGGGEVFGGDEGVGEEEAERV